MRPATQGGLPGRRPHGLEGGRGRCGEAARKTGRRLENEDLDVLGIRHASITNEQGHGAFSAEAVKP